MSAVLWLVCVCLLSIVCFKFAQKHQIPSSSSSFYFLVIVYRGHASYVPAFGLYIFIISVLNAYSCTMLHERRACSTLLQYNMHSNCFNTMPNGAHTHAQDGTVHGAVCVWANGNFLHKLYISSTTFCRDGVIVVVVVFVVGVTGFFPISTHNGKSVFNSHRVLRIVSLPTRQSRFRKTHLCTTRQHSTKGNSTIFFFIPKWENMYHSRKCFIWGLQRFGFSAIGCAQPCVCVCVRWKHARKSDATMKMHTRSQFLFIDS